MKVCFKEKGDNLGGRTFKGGTQTSARSNNRAVVGREEGQKADSVLDNWNNYMLSEYSF